MSSSDRCPYHSTRWRGETQRLLNVLRGRLLLPRHIRRFFKAVCTCKGGTTCSHSVVDLEKWCDGIKPSSTLGSAAGLLKSFLNSAKDKSLSEETKSGLVVMVATVKAASDGDYSALELPSKSDKPEPLKFEEQFEIPLSTNNIGVFVGSGGKYIKDVCSKYGVRIHLGEKTQGGGGGGGQMRVPRRSHTYAIGDKVKVTAYWSDETKDLVEIERFKQELLRRATAVKEKREQHLANVAAFYKKRQQRYSELRWKREASRTSQPVGVFQNPKEAAADQFEKKQHARSKQSTGPKASTGSSMLSEGHCLHCLAPYDPENKHCQYHSGYLVAVKQDRPNQGYSWSCCKKRTANKHPTHELHTKTGCCTGQHLWRPGKQAHVKGKSGASDKTGDFSV